MMIVVDCHDDCFGVVDAARGVVVLSGTLDVILEHLLACVQWFAS